VVLAGLAIAAIARVLAELVFNLLLAVGATMCSVLAQAVWLIVLVPATLVAGHRWGLTGISWANAAVAVFVALPAHAWGLRRGGLRIAVLGRACVFPLALGATTTILLLAVRQLSFGPVATLVLGGSITTGMVAFGYLRLRYTVEAALDGSGPPEPQVSASAGH
jgi:PST family polysaccharide transporter